MENKKGISLFILIISIIVILIFSGVVIYIVGKNNIIKNATRARLEMDLKSFNEEMERTYAAMLAEDSNFKKENITALEEDVVKKYIPSLTEEYIDKVTIVKGKLYYESFSKVEMGFATKLGYSKNKDKLPKSVKVHELNIHPECLFANSYICADGTFLIVSNNMEAIDGKMVTKCYITKLNKDFEIEWEKEYNQDIFEKKNQSIISTNVLSKRNGNILIEFFCKNKVEKDTAKTILELDLKGNEIYLNTKFYGDVDIKSIPKIYLEEKKNVYITVSTENFTNIEGKTKSKIIVSRLNKDFIEIKRAEIQEENGDLQYSSLNKDNNGKFLLNAISYNDNILYCLDKNLNIIKRGFIKAPSNLGKLESNCYGETFYINNEIYNYNTYKLYEKNIYNTIIRSIDEKNLVPKKEITKIQGESESIVINNISASKDGNLYVYGITNKKIGDIKNSEGSPYIEKIDTKLNEKWELAIDYKGGNISSVKDIGSSIYLLGIKDPYFNSQGINKENRFKIIIECEF